MLLRVEEIMESVIVGEEELANAEVAEMRGLRHDERLVFAFS
jgi:hypothetical protein